jgi:hypothetical protein
VLTTDSVDTALAPIPVAVGRCPAERVQNLVER